jgi:hypothetical protein
MIEFAASHTEFETMSESQITQTEARLNSHEAVCALRYEQINARLKRLEGVLMKTGGVLLCAMAAILWSVVYVR